MYGCLMRMCNLLRIMSRQIWLTAVPRSLGLLESTLLAGLACSSDMLLDVTKF